VASGAQFPRYQGPALRPLDGPHQRPARALLLLNAFAVVLPARRRRREPRHDLKSNTVKTHSLFRQGCMLYDLIPNMPENRLKPLVERYAELLHQSRVVSETFAIV
jgi:hypothetical protein